MKTRPKHPPCGARTRSGGTCKRRPVLGPDGLPRNGRCPNHGGLSTGPKSGPRARRPGGAAERRELERLPAAAIVARLQAGAVAPELVDLAARLVWRRFLSSGGNYAAGYRLVRAALAARDHRERA